MIWQCFFFLQVIAIYMGTQSGHFRQFPGGATKKDYNPAVRPWYVLSTCALPCATHMYYSGGIVCIAVCDTHVLLWWNDVYPLG